MSGNLCDCLPVTGAGDEFDRLSENFNVMLNHITHLNDGGGLKQAFDNYCQQPKDAADQAAKLY